MNTIIIDNNKNKSKNIIITKINELIEKNNSVLIYDLNGEYYSYYGNKLKSKNYNINVLNMNDLSFSNSFNPLLLPYEYYDSDINVTCDLLEKFWLLILGEDTELTKIATSFCLILFELAKSDAINLYSISSMLKTSVANLKKLNSNYLIEFYNLSKIEQEQGLKKIDEELMKYLIYDNLANVISYSNIEYLNKNAYFFIPSDENKCLNKLFFPFLDHIKYIHDNELNKNLGLVIEKTDNNISYLADCLENSFEFMFSCDDIENYKKYYSLDKIDVLYNIINDDKVIKVSKRNKEKLRIKDFNDIGVSTKYPYKETKVCDKYLFNLNRYIEKNKNTD